MTMSGKTEASSIFISFELEFKDFILSDQRQITIVELIEELRRVIRRPESKIRSIAEMCKEATSQLNWALSDLALVWTSDAPIEKQSFGNQDDKNMEILNKWVHSSSEKGDSVVTAFNSSR